MVVWLYGCTVLGGCTVLRLYGCTEYTDSPYKPPYNRKTEKPKNRNIPIALTNLRKTVKTVKP